MAYLAKNGAENVASYPAFHNRIIFNESFMANELNKTEIVFRYGNITDFKKKHVFRMFIMDLCFKKSNRFKLLHI